jgi:hypothetical protein
MQDITAGEAPSVTPDAPLPAGRANMGPAPRRSRPPVGRAETALSYAPDPGFGADLARAHSGARVPGATATSTWIYGSRSASPRSVKEFTDLPGQVD